MTETLTERPLLEISGLVTEFHARGRTVRAVDGLDLTIGEGEVVAIVGESGCGKSVTSLSVMQLLPRSGARIAAGSIRFRGEELLAKTDREMRAIRGDAISMIFQEPMTSLNPSMTIGDQIAEPLVIHRGMAPAAARERALELMRLIQIPMPERRLREYPHQLSGGMRQRVMIAVALICKPALLIADEPTTALDVTIQAQILKLMRELRASVGASILLITHDFGVVAEMASRVAVMYAGRKVEEANVEAIFDNPQHPYTRALLASRPKLGASLAQSEGQRLADIPGVVPALASGAAGCAFAPRCGLALESCSSRTPVLRSVRVSHRAACHRVPEVV